MTSSSTSYRLLGICGSLRMAAFSKAILVAVADMAASSAQFEYTDIGALPHFNQDLYVEPLPAEVRHLRAQITAADGLVISSPEYNHGMPGVLKNALDWASRPHSGSPLQAKPVLIITSSPAFTGGVRAQYQIRETLVSALARPVCHAEIVVGGVGAKIIDGRFSDAATLDFAKSGLARMLEEIDMLATLKR
jgi:chromate reductase, NAD(P)H dehydrogenase (quinone)